MKALYPAKIQKAVNALLTNQGSSSPELRQTVEAYAAELSGSEREASSPPADLQSYIDKVTLHAYKVTDKDVQQLKESGYSEDEILELTLCAGVGASLARLERGLLALKGEI